jgi:hypothetical protein
LYDKQHVFVNLLLSHIDAALRHVVDPEKPFLDSDSLYRFYPVPTDKEILEYVGDDWLNACITALDIDRKSQEWDFEKEVIENDFEAQTFTRKVKGEDLKAVKVVFKSKANPAKLIQLLHDEMVERHGEWGKGYIKGKVHYRVNDDVNIQHWEFSPGGVMRKRDFLVARRIVRQDNDGQIIIADRSIEHGYDAFSAKRFNFGFFIKSNVFFCIFAVAIGACRLETNSFDAIFHTTFASSFRYETKTGMITRKFIT